MKYTEAILIKQHSENVMVWNFQNADCSLRKKIIVSFIIGLIDIWRQELGYMCVDCGR